jgi:hypothetical protein
VSDRLRRSAFDFRFMGIVAAIAVALAAGLAGKWVGQRGGNARTRAEIAAVQAETAELAIRLDEEKLRRARLPAHLRGNGPGGLRAAVEDLFFDGPTAARSALSLTMEATGAGLSSWRYESEETSVPAWFPPDADGMEDGEAALPVRTRTRLVRWPLTFQLETDWESAVDLLARLEESRPAFGLEGLSIEPFRDDAGRLRDRLVVKGDLSTYWFQAEE